MYNTHEETKFLEEYIYNIEKELVDDWSDFEEKNNLMEESVNFKDNNLLNDGETECYCDKYEKIVSKDIVPDCIPREKIIEEVKKVTLADGKRMFREYCELSDLQKNNVENTYVIGINKVDLIGMWDTSINKKGKEGVLITIDELYYKLRVKPIVGVLYSGKIRLKGLFSVKSEIVDDFIWKIELCYSDDVYRSELVPAVYVKQIVELLHKIVAINFSLNFFITTNKENYYSLNENVVNKIDKNTLNYVLGYLHRKENDRTINIEEKMRIKFVLSTLYAKENDRGNELRWLKDAEDDGYEKAQNNIGKWYEKANDQENARECYLKAARQGDPVAQYNLANMMMVTQEKNQKAYSKEEIVYWYEQAAYQGNNEAEFILSGLYYSGKYVKEDKYQAISLLERAVVGENGKAQVVLGLLYRIGHVVKKDEEKAVLYFQKAVNNHEPQAFYELAKCYKKGQGVKQDIIMANYFEEKAKLESEGDKSNN